MTDQVHRLGEVLRAAREAKGVDLVRVERETKIRERYLSALERGEYRELPGSVYTKGFLRNYGAYLGLDPEYLIDLYRIETGASATDRTARVAPRPLATRRARAFVVTPNVVVGAILVIAVGAFIAYLAYELITFARQPVLQITTPAGNVSGYTELEIVVEGRTEPNAKVTVRGLPENPTVTADADGRFRMTVALVPGSNVMTLTAEDPETQRTSAEETRTIEVVNEVAASPSATPAPLTVAEPAADATVSGAVPISGTTAPNAVVTVTSTLIAVPTPTFTIADPSGNPVSLSPPNPTPPAPIELTADAAGAFGGTLALPAGAWDVSVAAGGEPATRRVTVTPPSGLSGTMRMEGGDSYVELEADGAPVASVSGSIVSDGETVEIAATRELRIRAGNAGAVRLTINGIQIGSMGGPGAVVEWRITRTGG